MVVMITSIMIMRVAMPFVSFFFCIYLFFLSFSFMLTHKV